MSPRRHRRHPRGERLLTQEVIVKIVRQKTKTDPDLFRLRLWCNPSTGWYGQVRIGKRQWLIVLDEWF